MLTFLAATVEVWQDEPAIPGGDYGLLLRRMPASGTNVTLRAYNESKDEIMVVDFQNTQGKLPSLHRVSISQPTADDRKYLEALEKHDIFPVDIEGKAFHG
jgi:hypothetical protein